MRHQQLRGIGRKKAGRQEINALRNCIGNNQIFQTHFVVLGGEVRSETIGLSEHNALRALAYVGIDEQHTLSGHGKDHSKVARNEALSLVGCGGSGYEHFGGAFHEVQAITQQTERFHNRFVGTALGYQSLLVLIIFPTRHFTDNGNGGEFLHIATA